MFTAEDSAWVGQGADACGQLVSKAVGLADLAERAKLYVEAQRIAQEEVPGITLGGRRNMMAVPELSLMEKTGLRDPELVATRYPHEISGGQRQRVVIAAALVGTPELIVRDEPATALDKTVEAQVLNLVSDIQKDINATLIYVSHDLHVIKSMCERVIVMKDGMIIEDGPSDDIFNARKTDYCKTLINAIPRIEANGPAAPTVTSTSAYLQLDKVNFSYASHTDLFGKGNRGAMALGDVNLPITRGQTLGIVGDSGSGKSTLAGFIAGLISGHNAQIMLNGGAVAGVARHRDKDLRRRLQMVFWTPVVVEPDPYRRGDPGSSAETLLRADKTSGAIPRGGAFGRS